MLNNKSRILLILFVVVITTVLISLLYGNKLFDKSGYDIVLKATATIAIFFLIETILSMSKATNLPQAYNVAIIGFPKSGKTTLIVSLFQEIFNRKIAGIKATLKGSSTIERLNEQIAKKEGGFAIGPTNDQTMFAYRTNIESKGLLFKKEYRVEFGDYPGEYSEELSDAAHFERLKKSEFFKWCIEADAYIFLIDVGKYLLEQNKMSFIAGTSKSIRESWQHFLDYAEVSGRNAHKKPVILVFNKMDLFCIADKKAMTQEEYNLMIDESGFSKKIVPRVFELNLETNVRNSNYLLNEFRDIISYMKSESNQFHVLFTSSFGMINKRLIGVHDILKYIFPPNIIAKFFKKNTNV